jgi:radical SAM superfamily enzyme YgiQ (UPF0313 family)
MKTAHVLFVYVDFQASTSFSMGLGVSSLSGFLKRHGRTSSLIYYKNSSDEALLFKRVREAAPEIIAFYSTSVSADVVKRLSAGLRREFPDLFQAYGGIHAILVPEILAEIQTLDALCAGYGELPLLELCERIETGRSAEDVPGMWVRTRLNGQERILRKKPWIPTGDVDSLVNFDPVLFLDEFERYPGFNRRNCRLEVIFNRVCPFGCTFCSNERLRTVLGKNRFLPSPERAAEVLRQALDDTGLSFVAIHDDILTLNKAWFKRFMELFVERIALPFSCNLRAGTFDEEDAALLRRAGVAEVWIGLESGNDHIRNTVMRKGISKEQLRQSFALLRKYHIHAVTQNLIGVPEESPETFLETVKLNAELMPGDSFLSVFYPYPTTSLFERCRSEGLITPHDQSFVERNQTTLALPGFPAEEIAFYTANFHRLQRYHRRWLDAPAGAMPELTAANAKQIAREMPGPDQ